MNRTLKAKQVMNTIKKIYKESEAHSINELRIIVALERAIARLERHPHLPSHLVFKGGFVLLKTLDTTRFTRDIDALAVGITKNHIDSMVEQALQMDLDDGFWFGDFETQDLKDQGSYGGLRFSCAFQIGDPPKEKGKVSKLSRIHIDIGLGDALNKIPSKQEMPSLLLDSQPVSWSVYPLEFIFAEKLETLFSRGSANSRAKDIYDMPVIFPNCNKKDLIKSIYQTFSNRNTPVPESFVTTAKSFDLTILKRSWKSVDLIGKSADFETSWNALISCLEKI